ncbi:hypothetical protein ACFX2C_003485 [Malus domestica]
MVEIRVQDLFHRLKRLGFDIKELTVSEILTGPVSRDGDLFAVVESCRDEAVEPRWSDSSGSDREPKRGLQIFGKMKIDPENAPPAVVMLAVKIYDGVAEPGGPATALADEYALAGSRCFEYDYIGVELMKLTAPWTGSVRGDGNEFSGERESGL